MNILVHETFWVYVLYGVLTVVIWSAVWRMVGALEEIAFELHRLREELKRGRRE